MVRFSLVPDPADRYQVHKLPKNRPIDSIDLNRLRKNNVLLSYRHFLRLQVGELMHNHQKSLSREGG